MSFFAVGIGAAGLALTAYSTLSKKQGVDQQQGAQSQITQEQIDRIANQERQANDISAWYNAQNGENADNSRANSLRTIAGANAPALMATEGQDVMARQAAGYAALDRTPNPSLYGTRNYSDGADDPSGAIKSENATRLVQALGIGRARADAGAKVNGWGDALLDNGIVINRGNQNQAIINRGQQTTDRIAQMKSTLNQQESVPILSPNAQYSLAGRVGVDALNTGTAIGTAGNVVSALGANGVIQKVPGAFDGLFQGAVPSANATGMAAMGPQQPGLFNNMFSSPAPVS